MTETRVQGDCLIDMVIGIGINTNQKDIPEEIEGVASSIEKEFGIKVDNERIIAEFCNLLERKIFERMS